MKKTLYEHKKGKQMKASGSWSVTSAERRLINTVTVFFVISVIAVLASPFVHRSWFLIASIICCAIKGVKASMILSAL